MRKVLVLIENSRAAIAELRSLKKMEDMEVHLAVSRKVFTDKIRYHKYIDSANYYSYGDIKNIIVFLEKLVEKIGSFMVLPNGEDVLREIVKSKRQLKELQIGISIPDENTYRLFSDKLTFAKVCNEFGIRTPHEEEVGSKHFDQKFVIKPKQLSNEPYVLATPLLIENEKSFKKFKSLRLDLSKHFVQGLIEGPSYYYCAAYEHGKKRAFFIQKNLHQQPNGKSIIKAIPFSLPDNIIDSIDKMMEEYHWEGVMMFELKECTKTGALFAIECNPRFWGPLQLAQDNDVDFVRVLVDPDYKRLNPVSKKVGYIWRAGYFHGLFLKLKTKTSFQKFIGEDKEINYKDIWGRNDTLLYFIMEPFIILMKEIRGRIF